MQWQKMLYSPFHFGQVFFSFNLASYNVLFTCRFFWETFLSLWFLKNVKISFSVFLPIIGLSLMPFLFRFGFGKSFLILLDLLKGKRCISSIYYIKKPSVSRSCSLTVGLLTTFVLRRTDAADREYIQKRTQAMYFALADVSSCNNKSSLLSFCLCPIS
jgi:hypothetical protein